MVSTKSLVSTAFAGLAFATLASAQNVQQLSNFRSVEGPLTRVKYDVATGTVTRVGQGQGFSNAAGSAAGVHRSSVNCFSNALTTGYYTGLSNGWAFMDFAAKQCNATETIGAFSFAYATTARDLNDVPPGPGASIAITFYSGGSAFCGAAGTFEAGFLFTGLPGAIGTQTSPGFLVTATFTGNSTFNLPDGPVDWGYTAFEGPLGTPAFSGPLLTDFSVNTGWGDVFDIYNRTPATTGTCLGAFFFGGCTPPVPPPPTGIPCGGFYLKLYEQGAKAAAAVFRNVAPNAAGYAHLGSDNNGNCGVDGVVAGPVIGENWITAVALQAGHMFTTVSINSNPLPGIPLGGPFGGTRLLCSGNLVTDTVGGPAPHCIGIPKDIGLIGATLCTQGLSGDLVPVLALRLNNALDITIGVR
jgi:hypothetical protein